MATILKIIDNGYEAFEARISFHEIQVKLDNENITVLRVPECVRYWIGNNRPRPNLRSEPNLPAEEGINVYYPTEYDEGNSLLIQISPTKYILVGHHIELLEIEETVTDFFSCVTNSDMIIPIIVTNNWVYTTYWGGNKFPRSQQTLDPLYHSYDTHYPEGIHFKTVYLTDRSSDMWNQKYTHQQQWIHEGATLFYTAEFGEYNSAETKRNRTQDPAVAIAEIEAGNQVLKSKVF